MSNDSTTTFTLPRPPDPAYVPSAAEREDSLEVVALERAIRAVVAGRSPAERPVIVAEALAWLELHAVDWCDRCRAALPEGICYSHAQGIALVDAVRRHVYTRLPGRPLIDVDL